MVQVDAMGYHARLGRSNGDGTYQPWINQHLLIPLEVRQVCAPAISQARFELNLPRVGDWAWNWRRHVGTDDLIAVRSDHPVLAERKTLFVGFVADVDFTFDTGQRVIVTANAMPVRLAWDTSAMVFGQWRMTRGGAVAHFTGLPCVFNAGGRPNRSKDRHDLPVSYALPPAPRNAYIFTHDHDEDAGFWTALEAMDYLLETYNDYANLQRDYWSDEEFARSPTVTADCDGIGLWEALGRIAQLGGYDVWHRITDPTAEEEPLVNSVAVTRWGGGPFIGISHQPSTAGGELPVIDPDQTNLLSASVAISVASCRTRPIVAGGRDLHEITIELLAGWTDPVEMPEGGSIVLPGDETGQADNPYVQQFCVGGTQFPAHAAQGRCWDANTDGLLGAIYEQAGLDPPAIADVAALALGAQFAGTWPVMAYEPRRMLTSIGVVGRSAGMDTYAEFSFDGGAHWYPLSGYRVWAHRIGIVIQTANLAGITPPDADPDLNFFQALLNVPDLVKVRLTCTVASPDRRMVCPERRPTAGTAHETSCWLDADATGQRFFRSASSVFAESNLPYHDPVESLFPRLEHQATVLQDLNEDRLIEASLALEWVDHDNQSPLTGQVHKIGGIEVSLARNAGEAKTYPRIIARRLMLTPDTYQTHLTLQTTRKAAVL